MPRQSRNQKPYIIVFCEGESEQMYTDFLKQKFKDYAVITRPKSTGLFEDADKKFKHDSRYRENIEVTDEVWFFFDVEAEDIPKWEERLKIIKRLRRLRKNPNIKVRLLMTTGCIEYWLLLHYRYVTPIIRTPADKDKVEAQLKGIEPLYKKGDRSSTSKIALNYQTARENAKKTVSNLIQDGLPDLLDTDERNQWLCKHCKTFSTVYEAIDFLTELRNKESIDKPQGVKND